LKEMASEGNTSPKRQRLAWEGIVRKVVGVGMCSVQRQLDLSDFFVEMLKHNVYFLVSSVILLVSLIMDPLYLVHAW
jgi:hypothetical protein